MKITVVAFDSRGGIQPYAALSLGLQEAGHEVTMAVTEDYAPDLRARGLTVAALSGDTQAEVRASGGAAEMSMRDRNAMMRARTAQLVDTHVPELLAAATGSDIITGGIGGGLMGKPVAEKIGAAFVDAHLQPIGPPTGAYPGVLIHTPSWLGAAGWSLSHRLTGIAIGLPIRGGATRARETLGLPAKAPAPDSTLPVLYGYSPLVVPKPPEWGPNRHLTGYWSLPAAPDWSPPEDLLEFLDAGPVPVCIGFGSMSSADPKALTDLVVAAAARAGARVVLLSGWAGLEADRSEDVYVTNEAPHDWLYPRTCAVVHHGGAGTTSAAILAGVPAIVVPFAVDQPFWGSRVQALGVGPRPIRRKALTVEALADALRQTLADTAMTQRAADLGRRVRAERGVQNAVAQFGAITR